MCDSVFQSDTPKKSLQESGKHLVRKVREPLSKLVIDI